MNRKWIRLTALMIIVCLTISAGAAVAEKTVVMTFTGDCTLGSEEIKRGAIDSFDTVANEKGYDYFFANFRELFEGDDQTVINFEGVLFDKRSGESKSKTYRFRGPTDFARILTGSSIEAASLANNHTADYGAQGFESTKKALAENGINWFYYMDYYTYVKDDIKIAFFAVDNRFMFNSIDKLYKLMNQMKRDKAINAIVICWHTGSEYRGNHDESTEKMCRRMIENGADLIVINHPHVLQGIQTINNRYVFYSLGNFVFGGNNAIRTEKYRMTTVTSLYTMVAQVKMTFSNEGIYLGQQATLYPAYTSSAAPVNNYQPIRVSAADGQAVRAAVQADTAFQLPELLETDGLSRMELDYLPGFDGILGPEDDAQSPLGIPEAASPYPTRESKGN